MHPIHLGCARLSLTHKESVSALFLYFKLLHWHSFNIRILNSSSLLTGRLHSSGEIYRPTMLTRTPVYAPLLCLRQEIGHRIFLRHPVCLPSPLQERVPIIWPVPRNLFPPSQDCMATGKTTLETYPAGLSTVADIKWLGIRLERCKLGFGHTQMKAVQNLLPEYHPDWILESGGQWKRLLQDMRWNWQGNVVWWSWYQNQKSDWDGGAELWE